ncbi:MAG: Trm112 family protein [bacterium]
MIDEKLLEILACPVCKAPLRLDGETLVCTKTGVRYPIEDEIPILLADRAQPPHPAEPDVASPPE